MDGNRYHEEHYRGEARTTAHFGNRIQLNTPVFFMTLRHLLLMPIDLNRPENNNENREAKKYNRQIEWGESNPSQHKTLRITVNGHKKSYQRREQYPGQREFNP